jgi:hypothetical protein
LVAAPNSDNNNNVIDVDGNFSDLSGVILFSTAQITRLFIACRLRVFFLVRKLGMVNERGNLLLVPQLRAAAIILQIKQHFLGTGREFCFDSANNSCSEWAKNANHVQAHELGAENGRG